MTFPPEVALCTAFSEVEKKKKKKLRYNDIGAMDSIVNNIVSVVLLGLRLFIHSLVLFIIW